MGIVLEGEVVTHLKNYMHRGIQRKQSQIQLPIHMVSTTLIEVDPPLILTIDLVLIKIEEERELSSVIPVLQDLDLKMSMGNLIVYLLITMVLVVIMDLLFMMDLVATAVDLVLTPADQLGVITIAMLITAIEVRTLVGIIKGMIIDQMKLIQLDQRLGFPIHNIKGILQSQFRGII